MARKDENLTWKEKLQAWWETDTAKAVATIIAVLLIPASVIAWNYATNRSDNIRDQLAIGGDSTEEATASAANGEDTETNQNEENAQSQGTNGQNAEGNTTAQEATQGQEPANSANTDTANDDQTAVGGLGSVQTLPNTDSDVYYKVGKGDNVYRISKKVCGNESYYKANLKANFLKVGQNVKVTCN